MARKKPKGTELPVFTGRAAKLNRAIFEVLRAKQSLASYDAYLEVRRIKGYRHTKYQTVDRRMKKLHQQRWITKKGTKKTRPGSDSPLYELSNRGQTALELDKVSMTRFVKEANDDLLLELRRILASFREFTRRAENLQQKRE